MVLGTILRVNDYVLLNDQTQIVIESIDGDEATGYDDSGDRTFNLSDVVHLNYNLDEPDMEKRERLPNCLNT